MTFLIFFGGILLGFFLGVIMMALFSWGSSEDRNEELAETFGCPRLPPVRGKVTGNIF